MQFEINRETKLDIAQRANYAWRLAAQGEKSIVVMYLNKSDDGTNHVAVLDARQHDEAKNHVAGDVFRNSSGGFSEDVITIYAPRPFKIDAEIKKLHPDALDYRDPLYKYSKEYRDLIDRYTAEHAPADVAALIQEAFKPHTVIFLTK